MIPDVIKHILHSHAVLAMEEAIVATVLRGAGNFGPYQKKLVRDRRLAYEAFVRQEANTCIELAAKHGGLIQ